MKGCTHFIKITLKLHTCCVYGKVISCHKAISNVSRVIFCTGDPQIMGHFPFTIMMVRFRSAKNEENMFRIIFGYNPPTC